MIDTVRAEDRALLDVVLAGLRRRPPALPASLFYDDAGSRLFDRITTLPSYYLTRCEREVLDAHGAAILRRAAGDGPVVVVEPGCGSGEKTARWLARAGGRAVTWVPVEVSASALREACARVRTAVPNATVLPMVADFTRPFALTPLPAGTRVLFFPGSTVGNLDPDDAVAFLARMAALLGPGARLVVGYDLAKDARLLADAYDDDEGVTAAFNRNALAHLNRRFGATFVPERFAHEARVLPDRVEMHLRAVGDQHVRVAGERFVFRDGSTIHTENTWKHTRQGFARLARRAGLLPRRTWTDARGWFAVTLLEAA
jgi:dimethylhistidine N-methyltransferase